MKQFIELTNISDDQKMIINRDSIETIHPKKRVNKMISEIKLYSGTILLVFESYEEIKQKMDLM